MDGLKTGYTRASGFNLAASAVRDGRRLVAVVIGGRSAGARDATMVALLDRGFERAPRPARRGGPGGRSASRSPPSPAAKEREVVVASLDTRASDAMVAVPSARPKRAAKPAAEPAASKRSSKAAKKSAKGAGQGQGQDRRRSAPATRGAYGVQVGAFRAAPQARAAMKQAMKRAPDLLRGTFASVGAQQVRNKPLFKATLVGLSRDDAEAACKRLKKQKQDCMVIQAGTLKTASG